MEKTLTFRTRGYKDLPREVQEKALSNYADINVAFSDWYHNDYLMEPEDALLKKGRVKSYGLEDEKVKALPKGEKGDPVIPSGMYVPSWKPLFTWKDLQEFDFERNSILKFEDLQVSDGEIFRRVLRIPARLWKKSSYYFWKGGRGFTEIEFEPKNEPFTEDEDKILETASEIFSDLAHEALYRLRKDYDYLTGEEAIAETFEANDYYFDDKGKLASPSALEKEVIVVLTLEQVQSRANAILGRELTEDELEELKTEAPFLLKMSPFMQALDTALESAKEKESPNVE